MLIDLDLIKTILRESSGRAPFDRTPETDLVMEDEACVRAYENGGRAAGALGGAYLYHLAHMCELIKPGDSVLDLGCGPGNLLALAAEFNPRADFTGVDLSGPMLVRAGATIERRGLSNVGLRRADMTALQDFPDSSFDAVVSSMALHHLPDLQALDRAFAEIARVLRPGGAVYLNDFGRLRTTKSVDYFVSRAAAGEERALVEDYAQSLRAAFSKDEFMRATVRHLGGRARLYATVVSPLSVVIKSGEPRRLPPETRCRLEEAFGNLPRARKEDVRQLKAFFRLGGLRSAL